MSIYFQFPQIEEYPFAIYPFKNDEQVYHPEDDFKLPVTEEDGLKLKDYLELKMI